MNVDVTLYYKGAISPGWANRLEAQEVKPTPAVVSKTTKELEAFSRFLREMQSYDRIIVHHHVEPVLALHLSKLFRNKVIWYSGSVFELAWEKFITGMDYREISPTVKKTSEGFYGRLLSEFLLSNTFFDASVQIARAIDITTVRSYRKIVANSAFLAKFLARVYNLRATPEVVYPGPDPLLEKLASEITSREEDFMLAVGSLIPLKNVEGIIYSAAGLSSAKIVIVGDGQERSRLKNLATKMNVPLEIMGYSLEEADLASAYSRCKFLVHLSLYEPFGLTPIEAGLFSKASIVTNRGGPSETVINGETGFVVNPRDYRTVGSRMLQLLQSTSLRNEMGKKARDTVVQKFTLRASAKKLLAEVEG